MDFNDGSSGPGTASQESGGGPGNSGYSAAGLGLEGVGAGIQGFAAFANMGYAKQIAGLNQQNYALQMQQQRVQWNQSALSIRRNQMQVLRNEQQSRHLAISTAANQGASSGSGLAGGLGQIFGEGATNLLALNQNYKLGLQAYNLNTETSANNMRISGLQGNEATAQGWAGLGSGIMSAGSALVKAGT